MMGSTRRRCGSSLAATAVATTKIHVPALICVGGIVVSRCIFKPERECLVECRVH
jgi:hypothetical protein